MNSVQSIMKKGLNIFKDMSYEYVKAQLLTLFYEQGTKHHEKELKHFQRHVT